MQQTKYKQTEIGEIPEEWDVGQLGNYCEVKGGKRLPKGYGLTINKTDHPYLRVTDFKESGIDKSAIQYIEDETYQKIKRYIVCEGDVCLSIVGTIGLVGIIDSELDRANLTENAAKLFDFHNIDNRFLAYYLKSNIGQEEIVSRTVGSTQAKLALHRIESIRLPVPPYSEQQRIANILSSLDDKIELNRKMNNTLEEIGKAFFSQLVMDPESSKKVELKDIVDINPTEQLKRNKNTRHVEMKDLPEQGVWASSEVFKPYKGGSKFRNGDTLMARITPCLENGKSAFLGFLNDGELAFGSTEFIVLRPKNKTFEEYVYYLVRDETFRDFAIKSMVGSSGRQRVQTDAIQHYQLLLPSDKLTENFHTLMEPIFEQIKANSLENIKLASIRDSLLPRLMSGKLRFN